MDNNVYQSSYLGELEIVLCKRIEILRIVESLWILKCSSSAGISSRHQEFIDRTERCSANNITNKPGKRTYEKVAKRKSDYLEFEKSEQLGAIHTCFRIAYKRLCIESFKIVQLQAR